MEREVYWSRYAADFEERNIYVAGSGNIEAIKMALSELALRGTLLDLGCGNGTYSQVLARTADKVDRTEGFTIKAANLIGKSSKAVFVRATKQ